MPALKYDKFTLHYDGHRVMTEFNDRTTCLVETNADHAYHAALTGMQPAEYNLLHEVAHHDVGLFHGHDYCPIVWASAHGLPMPGNAELLEWKITAISYMALSKPMRHDHEWGAIRDLSKVGDVYGLRDRIFITWQKLINDSH